MLITALDPDELLLGQRMRNYWISFAESLTSPNTVLSSLAGQSSFSIWPLYTPYATSAMISFDISVRV